MSKLHAAVPCLCPCECLESLFLEPSVPCSRYNDSSVAPFSYTSYAIFQKDCNLHGNLDLVVSLNCTPFNSYHNKQTKFCYISKYQMLRDDNFLSGWLQPILMAIFSKLKERFSVLICYFFYIIYVKNVKFSYATWLQILLI